MEIQSRIQIAAMHKIENFYSLFDPTGFTGGNLNTK